MLDYQKVLEIFKETSISLRPNKLTTMLLDETIKLRNNMNGGGNVESRGMLVDDIILEYLLKHPEFSSKILHTKMLELADLVWTLYCLANNTDEQSGIIASQKLTDPESVKNNEIPESTFRIALFQSFYDLQSMYNVKIPNAMKSYVIDYLYYSRKENDKDVVLLTTPPEENNQIYKDYNNLWS